MLTDNLIDLVSNDNNTTLKHTIGKGALWVMEYLLPLKVKNQKYISDKLYISCNYI